MAAALVEMAVRATSAPKNGRRPEPLVCILAGEATIEHLCELSTGLVLAPDLVVPHLGRSQVQTFIFDGADRVIAASPTRTFRGMLRRAIQVRDRHCQHPSGCDEPITHCDVNHRIPYAEGGITDEAGGDLECESHNRHSDLHDRRPAYLIDEARWRREMEARTRQRIDDLVTQRLQHGRPDHHPLPEPVTTSALWPLAPERAVGARANWADSLPGTLLGRGPRPTTSERPPRRPVGGSPPEAIRTACFPAVGK